MIDPASAPFQHVLIGDTGAAEKADMLPTLAAFLGKNHYYSFSLNDFWRIKDGVSNWQFDYPHTVNVDNHDYNLNIEDNSFYLTWVPAGKVDPVDANLAGMPAQAVTIAEFNAKTFYHLYDTSHSTDAMTPWLPKPQMDMQAAITVSDGAAGIILIDGKTHTVLQSNRDMFIIKNGDNQPSILFKGEVLANHLKVKWQQATMTEPKDD